MFIYSVGDCKILVSSWWDLDSCEHLTSVMNRKRVCLCVDNIATEVKLKWCLCSSVKSYSSHVMSYFFVACHWKVNNPLTSAAAGIMSYNATKFYSGVRMRLVDCMWAVRNSKIPSLIVWKLGNTHISYLYAFQFFSDVITGIFKNKIMMSLGALRVRWYI